MEIATTKETIMDKYIYLDYNATTPVDREVLEAMLPYLSQQFGNPSSNYPLGQQAYKAIQQAREQVGALIKVSADEIVFTSGGTESNNLAILGVAYANQSKGKHIITSSIEHPAVINVCKFLESKGWEVTYLPVDKNGKVNPEDVGEAIRPDTVLVSIMHANNEVGTIQEIEKIGEITSQNNVLFHTDAAQSLGKIKTQVDLFHVDLLSIAGHKLYAPKGVGALYVKKGVHLQNITWGASQEKGLKPGTENVAHIVALGKACEQARQQLKVNQDHLLAMKMHLLNGLKVHLDNVWVHGQPEMCLPNTLSMAIEGVSAFHLAEKLSSKVAISTGSACHANTINVSSVLKAMQVDEKRALSTVRLSVGKYTTREEIDRAVSEIVKAVTELK